MGYIRVYSGEELIEQMELKNLPLTIGRTADNRLMLPDPGVSRRHAIIYRDQGSWHVQDLDSRNGVFLNKRRISRQKLQYWDEVQIQQFLIRFMAVPAVTTMPEAEKPAEEVDEDDSTRFVTLTSATDLDKLRRSKREAYLCYVDEQGSERIRHIREAPLRIGCARGADIRLPGWFGPAEAARIERGRRGFQLIPGRRGKVMIDGRPVLTTTPIEDDTAFLARGQAFHFFHRPPE